MADRENTKLTREQMERVLRRAADIEQRSTEDRHELLSQHDIESLGKEAGISPKALQQALSEIHVGSLEPVAPTGTIDRAFGPSRLLIERVVPGTPDQVRGRVDQFLRDQYLTIKRDFGNRTVWEQAPGFLSSLGRGLDWSGKVVLGYVNEIEVSVFEGVGHGELKVRFSVDISTLRSQRLHGAWGGALIGGLVSGVMYALGGPYMVELMALGVGTAGLAVLSNWRLYRRVLNKTETSLERLLDFIEHGRDEPQDGLRRLLPGK